ncbi:Spy/CpxP family protein refolding chaperone [Flavobacterium sp. RSB2_4_14]|uniref:Spy/CpxP family protein refolding chaperone n=1 Tax=Flavobacterium sp. RSB2_4_14 TaxID=3447665 RepID=UPI003F414061
MEKTKLLTITIIGLLLLNLATLGFLFVSGPKGPKSPHDRLEGRPEPKEIIIEKLHLDAHQQKEYENLIQWHRGEIRQLEDTIHEAKEKLYSELMQPEVNVKTKDSLITLLARSQKQIEETHFKHFEDIKKLCKPEQQEYFNDLTEELGKLFSRNKPPRPRHD